MGIKYSRSCCCGYEERWYDLEEKKKEGIQEIRGKTKQHSKRRLLGLRRRYIEKKKNQTERKKKTSEKQKYCILVPFSIIESHAKPGDIVLFHTSRFVAGVQRVFCR